MTNSYETILNLTQHVASTEQTGDYVPVVDLAPEERAILVDVLTFDGIPKDGELAARAEALVSMAISHGAVEVMIGGAPWFMSTLEKALDRANILYCYSFSKRESVDTVLPDGTVKKTSAFRHAGWVRESRDSDLEPCTDEKCILEKKQGEKARELTGLYWWAFKHEVVALWPQFRCLGNGVYTEVDPEEDYVRVKLPGQRDGIARSGLGNALRALHDEWVKTL